MPLVAPDSAGYVYNALAIGTEGLRSLFLNGFTGNFSIYPILIYFVNLFVGDPILSGQLVSLFFGSLLIVTVYFLTKEMMGPRAGLLAAFLTAAHPLLIRYSVEVLKDSMLFFFAITSVVLALAGHERKKYLLIFLAGIMAWTTSFVRIFGVVIVVSISVAIVVSGIIERRKWHMIAYELVLFALPAPVAGYLCFGFLVGFKNEYIIQSLMKLFLSISERFSATASYRDILIANNPGISSQYLDVITSYPTLSAFAEFINVFVTAFSGAVFSFFLIGVYLDRSSLIKRGPRLFVLSCAVILTLADLIILATLFFLSKRHVMILVLLLFPWSAFALDRIIVWYRERVHRKFRMRAQVFNGIVSAVFVIWLILSLAFTSFLDWADSKHYYKREAAEYIENLGQPDPLILVLPSDRAIPLYAGGQEIILGDVATLEKIIAEKRPDFIVWNTNRGPLPESLKALSDAGIIEPIQTIKGLDDDLIVIYRRER
ncbi:MAG: glycosyltransferase family 39 protein [Deltaproteobacteria bacterium]|nr:glycosyltransferase family 39 protein [Candidatus Zymogenaceae bacterium]